MREQQNGALAKGVAPHAGTSSQRKGHLKGGEKSYDGKKAGRQQGQVCSEAHKWDSGGRQGGAVAGIGVGS